MYKLDLIKAEEPEIKLPTSLESQKKQENSKNIYFCFIDYNKAFDCVDHKKLWKILKETDRNTRLLLPVFWETCLQVKKKQLELDMKQWTSSKLGKKYVKAEYCHPAYLISMKNTSFEMLD